MATTFKTIFYRLQCLLGGGAETNAVMEDVAEKLLTYTLRLSLTTSADASTAVTEHGWVPIPHAGRIKSVTVTQSAAGTADASNYATVKLWKRDPTGTTAVNVASRTTAASDLVQYTGTGAVPMTITPAYAAVEKYGALSLSVTKSGTGLSTTAGECVVTIQRTD